MKSIYSLCLLAFLSVSASNLQAATSTQYQQKVDPTLAFFVALNECKEGYYEEKNIMASIVGPGTLSHTIDGEVKGGCSATLQTPDGRSMQCVFPTSELKKLADTHFMTGMLNATTDNPDDDAVNADMIWTHMKQNNCNIQMR